METGDLNNPKRMDPDHSQASHPTSGHTARRRSEPQRDQNETAERIKMPNQNDPRDFYLPLDCDELVACIANEAISLQPTDIQACLLPQGTPRTPEDQWQVLAQPIPQRPLQIPATKKQNVLCTRRMRHP